MWEFWKALIALLTGKGSTMPETPTAPTMAADIKVDKKVTAIGDNWWNTIARALVANGVASEALLFYVADVQLENGRTLQHCFCNNVGNVKLPAYKRGTGVTYFVMTDNQGSTDEYQAFPDLTTGIAEYVKEAVSRRPTAYGAARKQDLETFANTLVKGESGTTSDGYIGVDERLIKGWTKADGTKVPGLDLKTATQYVIYGAPVGTPYRDLTDDGLLAALRQLVKEGQPFYDKYIGGTEPPLVAKSGDKGGVVLGVLLAFVGAAALHKWRS